jgi:hypothetical protein
MGAVSARALSTGVKSYCSWPGSGHVLGLARRDLWLAPTTRPRGAGAIASEGCEGGTQAGWRAWAPSDGHTGCGHNEQSHVDTSLAVQGGNLSDIIDFMERMGSDAQLSQASVDELGEVLSATDFPPEVQSAMIARNAQQLSALLGTSPACVLVAPPHPPGPGPGPMQPAVPPPPPEEGEQEEPRDSFQSASLAENSGHRREPLRA